MIATIALIAVAMIAANAMGRGSMRGFRRVDLDAQNEVNGRLARMEEAIQIMASELERLRAARERDEYYLSGRADAPRVLPNSEIDNKSA